MTKSGDNKDLEVSQFSSSVDTRQGHRLSRETISASAVAFFCVLLFFSVSFFTPAMGYWSQLETVLILGSFLIVLSFGQGLVILIGGLDLSLPAVITLGGILATNWINTADYSASWYLIPAALLVCGLVGLFSAIGVLWLKVPSFIMTLAVSIILLSALMGFTKGTTRGNSPEALTALMKGEFLGVPVLIIFEFIFVIIAWLFQSRSVYGRYFYAVGTNAEAARIAAVPVFFVQIIPYVLSAICAGFVGLMLVGYSNGATLRMGENYLLPSIAAVVIGGSSILGGRGTFLGTVGGAMLLTILGTIISIIGLEFGLRTIIEGSIILIALLVMREELFKKFRQLFR